MKKLFTIIVLLLLASPIYADFEQVVIITQKGGIHSGIPFVPADQPDVYYNETNQEIIIVGPGYASYYDVDIVSISTGLMVYFDTIGGTGDTIDISSLPADDYILTITSSNNNVFEGQFCIEE